MERKIVNNLLPGAILEYVDTKDFVFQDKNGSIIPLEAKLADSVRAKSLKRFIELYKPPYAIRVSVQNFGYENNIKSIPLYAMFCLQR